jgi:hypothetical protein
LYYQWDGTVGQPGSPPQVQLLHYRLLFDDPGTHSPWSTGQDDAGQGIFMSISIENLELLQKNLVDGKMGAWYAELDPSDVIFKVNKKERKLDVDSLTSHLVQKYVKAGNNHPAKDFPHLFSQHFPDGVLTYEWSKGMGNNKGLLQVLKDPKVQQARSSDGKRTGSALLVWIDVFFINQMAKKVVVELAISQAYYILCENHIIAGSFTLLDRGWCIWELGLRAYSKKSSLIIGELEAKVWPGCISRNILELSKIYFSGAGV